MIGRARRAGFGALPCNLAALIEEVLSPGASREVGDEVEFVPQAVEFLLAFFVEDQLHQRRVVAEESEHAVIARAQQAAFVCRIVREIAAALGDVEGIRKNGSEARERGFIAAALGGRNDQIGIARASFRRERGPARSRFLVQIRILGNLRAPPAAGRYRCADRWDRYRGDAKRTAAASSSAAAAMPGGKPFTFGAANCIAVWARILTTKSRISTHFARNDIRLVCGTERAEPATLSEASRRDRPRLRSCRICQTIGRYFGLTFESAAMDARVACGLSEAAAIPEAPCGLESNPHSRWAAASRSR